MPREYPPTFDASEQVAYETLLILLKKGCHEEAARLYAYMVVQFFKAAPLEASAALKGADRQLEHMIERRIKEGL